MSDPEPTTPSPTPEPQAEPAPADTPAPEVVLDPEWVDRGAGFPDVESR